MSSPSGPSEVLATIVPAPWGPVHLAVTARGIVAVELMTTREAFDEGLVRRLRRHVRWVHAAARSTSSTDSDDGGTEHLWTAVAALASAIAGDDTACADLSLDLEDRPAWDRAVLGAVRNIPRGEVRSYGEIARAIGRPGAARAVGGAVGRNPVGFLIPCHRVVAGDGTLGGFGGGWWGDHERLLELKSELLAREGVSLPRSRSRGDRGR